VQDASHRAGFFSARTYHFTLRTGIQHAIDAAGVEGVALSDSSKVLLDFWAAPGLRGGGSTKTAIEVLLPPDLREYHDYLLFRESDATEPAPTFREEVERRLCWEITSEFSVMLTHGRTMERMGSAAVGWREAVIENTLKLIREGLPGVDTVLAGRDENALRIWLYGILQRYRERGVLYHPYLDDYAKKGRWGKCSNQLYGEGRETYPPAGRYKPRFLVSARKKGHYNILAAPRGKGRMPWHVIWTRRALGYKGDDATIIDLLKLFLKAATEAKLLVEVDKQAACTVYSISSAAAYLSADTVKLGCSESGSFLVRPAKEAALWEGAPSIDLDDDQGRYRRVAFGPRQEYYRRRYQRGALRKVVAHEHTGLLENTLRRSLEKSFGKAKHADDPNVLTCTSTLEMGIDIGDLSSTMLCSIPPSTANYLQRIGRAGRATGTAFIISIVNQRPHDLFFFGRPQELLKGKVDTPGIIWVTALTGRLLKGRLRISRVRRLS
jgi:DEAD/DEAH box helicase domain-containing protein